MLKFTRFILILLIFTTGYTVSAQDNINVVGGVFTVYGSSSQNNLDAHLNVENSSINDIAVLVDRDISMMHPAHRTYYCWAQCYDTTVSLSPDPVVLPGLTIDSTTFHSYIYTFNTIGVSQVTYTFFDQYLPTDSSQVTITYNVGTIGISDIQKNLYRLGTPSPNPANNMTSLVYNMPVNQVAKLCVRDMIGNIIQVHPLSVSKGVIIIPTSELSSGIYTCSIVSGESNLSSVKLVVSHR
jgi:hypothetical protein